MPAGPLWTAEEQLALASLGATMAADAALTAGMATAPTDWVTAASGAVADGRRAATATSAAMAAVTSRLLGPEVDGPGDTGDVGDSSNLDDTNDSGDSGGNNGPVGRQACPSSGDGGNGNGDGDGDDDGGYRPRRGLRAAAAHPAAAGVTQRGGQGGVE